MSKAEAEFPPLPLPAGYYAVAEGVHEGSDGEEEEEDRDGDEGEREGNDVEGGGSDTQLVMEKGSLSVAIDDHGDGGDGSGVDRDAASIATTLLNMLDSNGGEEGKAVDGERVEVEVVVGTEEVEGGVDRGHTGGDKEEGDGEGVEGERGVESGMCEDDFCGDKGAAERQMDRNRNRSKVVEDVRARIAPLLGEPSSLYLLLIELM